MENILEIDLNEIANKQITKKIKALEKQVTDCNKTIDLQKYEIQHLKLVNNDSDIANSLLGKLRTAFSEITKSNDTDGGWYDSKQKNQFKFIEAILLNLFGIPKGLTGWQSSRSDGTLAGYLAVNYYNNKATVIELLKALMPNPDREISFIESFKMPFDYPKSDVVKYISAPQYNTNGCIFEISQYWVENGLKPHSNMPHGLIMKNPFILKDDVFSKLLESIDKKVPNYFYLFSLPKYNVLASKKQIEQLGERIINLPKNIIEYDSVKEFVSKHLHDFNKKTIEYLYDKMVTDAQFNMWNWEKFPPEYQMRFLMSKPFEEILKLITGYNCKWSTEQKQSFLDKYLKNKPA